MRCHDDACEINERETITLRSLYLRCDREFFAFRRPPRFVLELSAGMSELVLEIPNNVLSNYTIPPISYYLVSPII